MMEEDVDKLQEKIRELKTLFFWIAGQLFFYIKSEFFFLWYDKFSRTRCSTHSPAIFLLSCFSS